MLLRAAELLKSDLGAHRPTFALETGSRRGWADMIVIESPSTLREKPA